MAPSPLRLMVVQLAGGSALRTGPTRQVFVSQIDVHFLGFQLQVHGGHSPGLFQAQNPPVKLSIFHGYWMGRPRLGVRPAARPQEPNVDLFGSDWRFGAAEAAPAIPALESALGSHSCGALSSAQVPPL